MAFPPLRNSDCVVTVFIDFPINSKQDVLFHRIAYDYSFADWDGRNLALGTFDRLLIMFTTKVFILVNKLGIYRVCVKGSGLDSWLEAAFLNEDPTANVCSDGRKRNLDYFTTSLRAAVSQTETDENGGEITVRLPSETIPLVEEKKTLRLSIEFVLDKPSSGIHFVVPNGEGSPVERACHMFCYKWGNSSRLWFPCIDSLSEVCTWKIEVTADTGMSVVCPGELVEKVFTPDEKRITHHFTLAIPTSASNIGIAVGPFEIIVDPEMSDITYFVLPGMKDLVRHSTSFLTEAFDYFEENLNNQYPFASFKLVFVNEAYEELQSYTSMGILSLNLLHPSSVIDQTFITRRYIVQCITEQFFGMFVAMQTWADYWLLSGISKYLTGLFLKKMFGNNEYRHWLKKEMQSVCDYELDGPGLPTLYPFPLVSIDGKQDQSKLDSKSSSQSLSLHQHPQLTPFKQLQVAGKKSHLIMRMIELRIGQDLLLQAFNKVLSLASAASSKRSDFFNWSNMLLSTNGFLRTISTVSGKDINQFLDKWICHSGVAKFSASFSFNRKRNIVELEITQSSGKGCQKYVGPLTVSIQELDGSFQHPVQVEEIVNNHELPCHSKSRRNKKKKIPLVTGEEVDMDLNATMDTDSPVLWIRIDPDMTWLRTVTLQQPDYMWQYQLRYERDVVSQIEAVQALCKYPCPGTRSALVDIINQNEAFYKVRLESCDSLAKICTEETEVWDGELKMLEIFQKMFGSSSHHKIPKFNDFSNFISYFLQKHMPVAVSSIRNKHSQCSQRVVTFILDLIKYNDNRFNQYLDSYYMSSLIDALSNTIGPAIQLASSVDLLDRASLPIDEDAKAVLSVVNRRLNMDKILPSYRYVVSCSCLKALRSLQINGHIPAESAFFKHYARYGVFEDVRLTALEIMVDFIFAHHSEKDLEWLLDLIERDPVPYIRHQAIQYLVEKPPFTKKTSNSPLNNQILVERIWQLMKSWESLSNERKLPDGDSLSYDSVNDFRLRCDLMELYNALWGRVTPNCVPAHGVGVVIDLKEKRAVPNTSSYPVLGSPDVSASVSAGEEPYSKKRRSSYSHSPNPYGDYIDSKPGTPMSVNSEMSAASKLKLKIKFNEENSHDSGSDMVPSSMNQSQSNLQDDLESSKKVKKKKKKKHKKDKKDRNKTDFFPTGIPGTHIKSLDDRLAEVDSSPNIMESNQRQPLMHDIHEHEENEFSFDANFKQEISDIDISPRHGMIGEDNIMLSNEDVVMGGRENRYREEPVIEYMKSEDEDSDISI